MGSNFRLTLYENFKTFGHYSGVSSPGDDSQAFIWDAVSSWRAFLPRASRSFPCGSFRAAFFVASDISCHFYSILICVLVRFIGRAPCLENRREHAELSVTDESQWRCGDDDTLHRQYVREST